MGSGCSKRLSSSAEPSVQTSHRRKLDQAGRDELSTSAVLKQFTQQQAAVVALLAVGGRVEVRMSRPRAGVPSVGVVDESNCGSDQLGVVCRGAAVGQDEHVFQSGPHIDASCSGC